MCGLDGPVARQCLGEILRLLDLRDITEQPPRPLELRDLNVNLVGWPENLRSRILDRANNLLNYSTESCHNRVDWRLTHESLKEMLPLFDSYAAKVLLLQANYAESCIDRAKRP